MNQAILAALIAAFVAVTLALITTFVGEQFKRFHDGSALAAGIAGELASYQPALPMLNQAFRTFLERLANGDRQGIALRSIDRPHDVFYESAISKIGVLGSDLVEDIVFVYSQIGGMRTSMSILAEKSDNMNDTEMAAHLNMGLQFLERANDRGAALLPRLRRRAAASFWHAFWSQQRW